MGESLAIETLYNYNMQRPRGTEMPPTETPISTETLALQIRRDALVQIHGAGSGHPGGSLSCADILAVLYGEILNLEGPHRDRFVMSKGHACPALYAAWMNTGLMDRSELSGFRKAGRKLQGHPHVGATPLAETSTGSLGQGFSTALGMAMGYKHQQLSGRIFALLGDGELQEGIVWEAAMCAAHYTLDNLIAIIDYNKLQSDATNTEIMGLEPLGEKWRAFGWHVVELDGHDQTALKAAFQVKYQGPTVIIAHTVKGKGVSWMENIPTWHGSVKLKDEELESALRELQ
jgi:transketolase